MMLYETDCYYCKSNKICRKAYNAMFCTNGKKNTDTNKNVKSTNNNVNKEDSLCQLKK